MALSKNGINAVGVVLSGSVLLGGIYFGVLPQLEAAEEYNQQTEQVATTNTAQNERLAELSEYQDNPQALEQQLSTMRDQLPNSNSATDIQRAIVESLSSSVELISFSYGDSQSFEQPEAPSVSLGESSVPFEIGEDTSSDEEEDDGDAGGVATGLTATPVEIRVSARGSQPLSDFLNNLQSEGRLFLVSRVDIADGESSQKDAHIHAWALSNH